MLISHSHNFIFVHVYKTGGSSVKGLLHEVCDRAAERQFNVHVSAEKIRAALPELWQQYFTFACVRNPWDFCVSLYHWLCEQQVHDMAQFVRELGSFREFI